MTEFSNERESCCCAKTFIFRPKKELQKKINFYLKNNFINYFANF